MNPETPEITRRTMLGRSTRAGAAALVAGGLAPLSAAEPRAEDDRPLVWDMHGHLTGVGGATAQERITELLMYADRMGIDRLIVFMGLSFVADPTPDFHMRFWTAAMDAEELTELLRLAYRKFYFRPSVVWRNLKQLGSAGELRHKAAAAIAMLRGGRQ